MDAINKKIISEISTFVKYIKIQGEGRVSKGAAYALRGKAYLITKEYDKAIADFAKVGECGYKLFPDYKQLFKVANERCEEVILAVQYIEDPTGYGTSLQKFCAAFTQGSKDGRGCWGDLQVTPAVVNLYEEFDGETVKPFAWKDYLPEGNEARLKKAYAQRDPRLAYNVVTPYSHYLGVNNNSTEEAWYTFRWPVAGKYYSNVANAEPNANPDLPEDYYTSGCMNAQAEFKYIHRKFVGEGLEYQRRENNPVDEPIIRYADVLLMWAEALVEKGDLTGAMAKVKEVRDRAGILTMASNFGDQNTARNYVRDERRREFVNEGVNFFDEMRWRTLKETKFSEKNAQHAWGGLESTGGTIYDWIGDYWYTWPVPKSEIELNPNMKRTPGWEY